MSRGEVLIYLAGLFDGEGYIGTNKYKVKKRLRTDVRVVLSMSSPFGPTLFADAFDGVVGFERRAKFKNVFRCDLRARKAEKALLALLPFLREKKDQANIALQIRHIQSSGIQGKAPSKDRLVQEQKLARKLKSLKKIRYGRKYSTYGLKKPPLGRRPS